MSGVNFNVNINNGMVEVFNETPTTGAEATQGAEAKPTLTLVQSQELAALVKVYVQTAIQLAPPGFDAQTNAGALAQGAIDALKQMAPGFGITAEALKDLNVTVTFGTTVADLATTPGADPKAVADAAGQLETMAGNLSQALQELITNSSYPNFTDVLKELMSMAQQLKEAASMVKMGAIEGKYELQMAGAEMLRDAAKLDASSREKNIKAERTQAWVSMGTSVVGTVVGFGVGGLGGAGIGQTLSGVGQAAGTLVTTKAKLEASADQLNADLMRADKGKLDAEATKQDANIQIIDEIEEAAKKLREAALQGLGTLISNHAQILRSAAEV